MLNVSQQRYLDAYRRHPAVKAALKSLRYSVKSASQRKWWILRVEFDGVNPPYLFASWHGTILARLEMPSYLELTDATVQQVIDNVNAAWRLLLKQQLKQIEENIT